MDWKPHSYQRIAQEYAHKPASGLLLDPGLGKTSIILSTLKPNTLVIAPKVLLKQTWMEENDKWGFGHDMVVVEGSANKRNKILEEDHDVYLINPELIPWLAGGSKFRTRNSKRVFDSIVIDESTRFKNHSAKRFKALANMIWKQGHGKRSRTIMTGTPVAKNACDMWSQMYLLDKGERLGEKITTFRRKYCRQGGFKGREWIPKTDAPQKIAEACSDILLRMDNDQLEMPDLIVNDIEIPIPSGEFRDKYKMLKDHFLYGEDLSANAGVVYGRLRQMVSGAMYTDGDNWDEIDTSKLDRLEELLNELNGKPLLVAYHFKHDMERIIKRFPGTPVIKSWQGANDHVDNWNKGRYPMMLIQPASAAYGLNLQKGGSDLCWFTLSNSAEQYNQTNARIFRQGQDKQVRIHRLLMKGTVDIATRRLLSEKHNTGDVINSTIKLMRENDE